MTEEPRCASRSSALLFAGALLALASCRTGDAGALGLGLNGCEIAARDPGGTVPQIVAWVEDRDPEESGALIHFEVDSGVTLWVGNEQASTFDDMIELTGGRRFTFVLEPLSAKRVRLTWGGRDLDTEASGAKTPGKPLKQVKERGLLSTRPTIGDDEGRDLEFFVRGLKVYLRVFGEGPTPAR